MTEDMGSNLEPEELNELMGDNIRKYRQRNRQTNVIQVIKVSNHNHLTVEKQLELLNLNDPDNEYSELPDDREYDLGDCPVAEGEENIISITIPKI